MDALTTVRLMADYNTWMNERVYEAVAQLSNDELWRDRGAFFKSVGGTLNHLMVADRIWLSRFATHPAEYSALEPFRAEPASHRLDEVLYSDFDTLHEARRELDAIVTAWCEQIEPADMDRNLVYRNTKGVGHGKPFGLLVMHFFNHQTHHRGQLTTLLTQQGLDVGLTDLLVRIPESG